MHILKGFPGASMVVQQPRLGLPLQRLRVWSLVGELRFHMLHGQNTKTPLKTEPIL